MAAARTENLLKEPPRRPTPIQPPPAMPSLETQATPRLEVAIPTSEPSAGVEAKAALLNGLHAVKAHPPLPLDSGQSGMK
jgi:hypothetical protein